MARVRDDDDRELIWSGSFAWVVRPMTVGTVRQICGATSVLFALAGVAILPLAIRWIEPPGSRPGLAIIAMAGAFGGTVFAASLPRQTPEWMERWGPRLCVISQGLTPVLVAVAVVAVGPTLGLGAIYFSEVPLIAFMYFRTRWAVLVTGIVLVAFAVALWALDDPPYPVEQWFVLLTASVATAGLVGDLTRRTDEAHRAERAAKAALADLNQHLEVRVAEQVDELERTGRLRRFLAPQVADVVSGTDESLLEPHRREVAVMFCDLRGFTRFTNSVEPDTVVAVLGEYYAAVGGVLEAHGATIGGYDGDGIMAYLGDPIPRPDADVAGLEMARAIGTTLDDLVGRWRSAGHDLGYGIGLAHGPATLGVVGFDGRFDYTALGAVVNLAARLCADASSGEIVIDTSMLAAADTRTRHRGDVTLKGFDAPVPTYALL